MAQVSLFNHLLTWSMFGLLLLIVCGAAWSITRRLYRRSDRGQQDDAQ